MNSLDPKLTAMVYIGGAVIFVVFLLVLFFYTRSVKLKNNSGSREQEILQATEKKERVR